MTTEKFYFIRNGQQIGPIEAEQLAHENITPQTMVWRQGMEDWKEARSWSIASMAVAVALVLLWGVIVFFSAVLDSAY